MFGPNSDGLEAALKHPLVGVAAVLEQNHPPVRTVQQGLPFQYIPGTMFLRVDSRHAHEETRKWDLDRYLFTYSCSTY